MYVSASEPKGLMVALNPDGTLKWDAQLEGYPASAAIGGDGTVYIGVGFSDPAGIWAFGQDGTLKWVFDDPLSAASRTSPAIGVGRVVGASEGGLFVIGP
jgi:outer membrane protein assembly factor BamB